MLSSSTFGGGLFFSFSFSFSFFLSTTRNRSRSRSCSRGSPASAALLIPSARRLQQKPHRFLLSPSSAIPTSSSSSSSRLITMDSSAAQGSSSSSSSSSATPISSKIQNSKKLQFGTTHVIQPKGEHLATVVWLHGLGDVGASWADALKDLPLQNIKWIVPTAPIQPVAVMGGFPCNAWFDVGSLSEEGLVDLEGLDLSAAHVAELLSKESSGIKLGVGGFSQGAATSLYTSICSVTGKYGNGVVDFPCKINICTAISGWLPAQKNVENRLRENTDVSNQQKQLPFFFGHGTSDDIVLFKFGEKSAAYLQSVGFSDVTFKTYKGMGHYTSPTEMNDICAFFKLKLKLEG